MHQKILLIEDDNLFRKGVVKYAKTSPFQDLIAPSSPSDLLNLVKGRDIHSIVIDFNLFNWFDTNDNYGFSFNDSRVNNGIHLAEQIKFINPAVEILMYSAFERHLSESLKQAKSSAVGNLIAFEEKGEHGNIFGFLDEYLKSVFIHPIDLQNGDTKTNAINEWARLMDEISGNSQVLYNLSWMKLEDLVGYILEKNGWKVTQMGRTKDGGIDLIATQNIDPGIPVNMMIQCKKFSSGNRVGVEIVKEVWATKMEHQFNKAMIVTTSFFTKGAKGKAEKWNLELRDHNDIFEWCKQSKKTHY